MENTVYYFYAIYRSGRVFIMQFVESKDLRPGMRLAKPIYNKNGVLLYERDTRLSVQVINNIQNFMLIGVYILEPANRFRRFPRKNWILSVSRPSRCSSFATT